MLTVPAFTITQYLPEVIDGVFKALEDPTAGVRDATVSVLTELLHKLDPKLEEDVNFFLCNKFQTFKIDLFYRRMLAV